MKIVTNSYKAREYLFFIVIYCNISLFFLNHSIVWLCSFDSFPSNFPIGSVMNFLATHATHCTSSFNHLLCLLDSSKCQTFGFIYLGSFYFFVFESLVLYTFFFRNLKNSYSFLHLKAALSDTDIKSNQYIHNRQQKYIVYIMMLICLHSAFCLNVYHFISDGWHTLDHSFM